MVKSNKKATLKIRETHFPYRKHQKPKIAKNFSLLGRTVPKKRKVASNRRNNKLGVSLKNGPR